MANPSKWAFKSPKRAGGNPWSGKPSGVLSTAVLLYDSGSGVPARRVDILRTGRKSRGVREYVAAW